MFLKKQVAKMVLLKNKYLKKSRTHVINLEFYRTLPPLGNVNELQSTQYEPNLYFEFFFFFYRNHKVLVCNFELCRNIGTLFSLSPRLQLELFLMFLIYRYLFLKEHPANCMQSPNQFIQQPKWAKPLTIRKQNKINK